MRFSIWTAVAVAALAMSAVSAAPTSSSGHAAIEGVIRDGSGAPLQGVRLRLVRTGQTDHAPVDGQPMAYLSDPVDVDGWYRMTNLPDGRFAVQVIWLGSGNVYPWAPEVTLEGGRKTRRDIKVSFSFPEPYPGAAGWAAWKNTSSDHGMESSSHVSSPR
jgi:hypothetical protein